MKFLRNKNWLVNLAHIIDINVSANYLVLTTIDGREEKFIYGPESDLEVLVAEMVVFASDTSANVLDCQEFMHNIR